MTFEGTWAVNGFNVPGTLWRLQLQSATRSGNGIVELGDLRVEAQASPTSTVTVSDGACVALGRERLWQGSYYGYHVGSEDVNISPTGGTPRSDLIYARVEDPTISSSPWSHVGPDEQLWYIRTKSGVSSSATDVPIGETGVALARVDVPANTSAITADMIHDLREMLNAREQTGQLVLAGSWTEPDSLGNTIVPDYEQWPSGASWQLDVPPWAGQLVVSYAAYGIQYRRHSDVTADYHDAEGYTRVMFGNTATDTTRYWIRDGNVDYTRSALGGGATIAVPQAKRGTVQTLQVQGAGDHASTAGRMEADGGSVIIVTYTFREVPRHDVPDRSPS